MQNQEAIKLKGIVIATAWKENGDVAAVDIAGYDEKRYHVANDLMGRKLWQLATERLIVEGVIETTAQSFLIHVKQFRFDKSAVN